MFASNGFFVDVCDFAIAETAESDFADLPDVLLLLSAPVTSILASINYCISSITASSGRFDIAGVYLLPF